MTSTCIAQADKCSAQHATCIVQHAWHPCKVQFAHCVLNWTCSDCTLLGGFAWLGSALAWLWLWFLLAVFSLCLRLSFPLILLVCSFVSACISLYFCVRFSLFRLVFLIGFLLVSACVAVFLLVPACVSPGLCLCCSLFLRVFPSASASSCLCFCVCACFVCWICLCLLHCFCTSLGRLRLVCLAWLVFGFCLAWCCLLIAGLRAVRLHIARRRAARLHTWRRLLLLLQLSRQTVACSNNALVKLKMINFRCCDLQH